jgi:hypothetical protein
VSVAYPPAPAAPGVPRPRGHAGSRLRAPILLAVFAGVLAAVLIVALIAVKSAAPAAPKPQCPGGPCGNPPTRPPEPPAPAGAPALVHGQIFKSSGLGYQFEFNQFGDRFRWKIEQQDAQDVTMTLNGGAAILSIRGVPASQASPEQLFNEQVAKVKDRIPDLQVNDDPRDAIVAPSVGFHRGIGDLFGGTFQTPQGAGIPVVGVITAATDGQATLAMTVLVPDSNRQVVFTLVDGIMNTFRFPSEIQQS